MTPGKKVIAPRLIVVLAFLAGLSTACGQNSIKRANLLLDDVRGYHDGIRWEKFSQAVLRKPADERSDFLLERDELAEDLRISDYEIVRVHYLKKDMRAEVIVRYMWHLDSRGIVHKTTAKEVWERRGKRWIIAEEARTRGKEMPGLAEPEESDEDDPDKEPVAATRSVSAADEPVE